MACASPNLDTGRLAADGRGAVETAYASPNLDSGRLAAGRRGTVESAISIFIIHPGGGPHGNYPMQAPSVHGMFMLDGLARLEVTMCTSRS